MSRTRALDVLTAGFGQLISLYKVPSPCGSVYRLVRLIYNGGWSYEEQFIDENESLQELVFSCFPEARNHYDVRFDTIEPVYLAKLRNERKAKRLSKANSSSVAYENGTA